MKTIIKLLVVSILVFALSISAYESKDFAVQVEARMASGGGIEVDWPTSGRPVTDYTIWRKSTTTSWTQLTTNPIQAIPAGDLFRYTDPATDLSAGSTYEYQVIRNITPNHADAYGNSAGYGYARIGFQTSVTQAPIIHTRGKLVLLVDRTVYENDSAMAGLLRQFQADLVGDGWQVLRHDVDRGLKNYPDDQGSIAYNAAAYKSEVQQMHAIIKADYDADPNNVKAVSIPIWSRRCAVFWHQHIRPRWA
jgi:hypothetical protein